MSSHEWRETACCCQCHQQNPLDASSSTTQQAQTHVDETHQTDIDPDDDDTESYEILDHPHMAPVQNSAQPPRLSNYNYNYEGNKHSRAYGRIDSPDDDDFGPTAWFWAEVLAAIMIVAMCYLIWQTMAASSRMGREALENPSCMASACRCRP